MDEVCPEIVVESVADYENDFDIYPNPVENNMIVASDENIDEIIIYNTIGDDIYIETVFVTDNVDISGLSSGVYFY